MVRVRWNRIDNKVTLPAAGDDTIVSDCEAYTIHSISIDVENIGTNVVARVSQKIGKGWLPIEDGGTGEYTEYTITANGSFGLELGRRSIKSLKVELESISGGTPTVEVYYEGRK